jgi:UDP-N-acetylglucosamine acyltransferase
MVSNLPNIHPTAIIEDGAQISDTAKIGAYCCIEKNVVIGDNAEIMSHVVIAGHTKLASGVKVYSFASVGTAPQDLKYAGEETFLEIGANTTIREHVTINTGTQQGGGLTKIGNNCLLMVGAHVAHDCKIGNNVILVNNATCAGHVEIGDHAVLGGLCAVHQFVRIGDGAMIGGMSGVERDVIPYGSVLGNRAKLKGLNIVGLKRQGFDKDMLHRMRRVYQILFEDNAEDMPLQERAEKVVAEYSQYPEIKKITDFINTETRRSFCGP